MVNVNYLACFNIICNYYIAHFIIAKLLLFCFAAHQKHNIVISLLAIQYILIKSNSSLLIITIT